MTINRKYYLLADGKQVGFSFSRKGAISLIDRHLSSLNPENSPLPEFTLRTETSNAAGATITTIESL